MIVLHVCKATDVAISFLLKIYEDNSACLFKNVGPKLKSHTKHIAAVYHGFYEYASLGSSTLVQIININTAARNLIDIST